MEALIERLQSKQARVVVMGIGYVGLPLAVEFSQAGFRTTGFDHDGSKVEQVNAGKSYISDVPQDELAPLVEAGRLDATTDSAVLNEADAVIVCVPTPLNKTKDPDMRFILAACEEISKHQHPGMVVVLESTTYPGTTREVMVPTLTRGDFELGKDVYIAFSPERVDPGNPVYKTKNTPKVLGGVTPACLETATALYQHAIDTIVPVSSPEAAEMVKLLENTFRAVNIGLVNEIALMSRRLNIDVFEVIRAAGTKPFGFMPFFPGPGLGGHCIPIDPLYLSWKLRSLKYQARFIDLADAINSSMPGHVVDRAAEALNTMSKPVRGSKVLIYGMAYKRDVDDVRESPSFDVLAGLTSRGAEVEYMDPHVASVDEHGVQMTATPEDTDFGKYDLVVVITDHKALDRQRLMDQASVVLDTRDALRGLSGKARVHGL